MFFYFRYCILLFLLIPFFQARSQNINISGRITDSITGQPLAFVNIVSGSQVRGTLSDVDGKFKINVPESDKILRFTYVGYYSKVIHLDMQEYIHVKMCPRSFELSEVVILPTENPAHRIIKKVIENKDINNPMKQTSFTYKAYNRFFINPDAKQLKISLEKNPGDTTVEKAIEFSDKQYMFLMESVSERTFVMPDKSSEKIIAYKVSGFKDPLFAMVITQIQPFTFYDDFIKLLGINYVNPISNGSLTKYYFQIEDTLYQNSDSVYVISFKPNKDTQFDGLKGLLYINTDGYAIQNVIAESATSNSSQLKMQQMYDKVDNKQWFPIQLNTDISINNMGRMNFGLKQVGVGRTYIKDIVFDNSIKKNRVGSAEVEVDPVADKNSEAILEKYRINKPDAKDSLTYHSLDSIGKKYKFDQRITSLNTVLNGKIPYKFIDIDINKLLDINRYESVRIGLRINTNRKVSKVFSLGLYAAYGFRDKKLKYGGDIEFKLHHKSAMYLKAYYFDDIIETGKFEFVEKTTLLSAEWFRTICLKYFDRYRKAGIEINFRPISSVQLRAGASISDITNMYDYRFQSFSDNSTAKRFTFRDVSMMVSLRYAHGEHIIRNLDYDVVMKNEKGPVLNFSYIHGFKNLLGGSFNYNKLNFKITRTFHYKYFGKSVLSLMAGYTDKSLPVALLYSAGGSEEAKYFQVYEAFSTMNSDAFYSNICISIFGRHEFPGFFKRHSWFDPKAAVFLSAGWGKLYHKEYHQILEVKSPDKIYSEAGLMFNDFIKIPYLSFGIGIFYRFGPYSSVYEKKNFFPRWNLKVKI